MKKLFPLFVIIVLVMISCSGNAFSVKDVITQPFMDVYSNKMGLSVYVRTNDTEDQTVSFEIKNPNKTLTWTVNANKVAFENGIYYGSSDIFMPGTKILETGEWTLTVMSKDGSAEDFKFNVNYSYGRPENGKTNTYYDENLNLTFVFK